MTHFLLIGAGGFLGAVSRYAVYKINHSLIEPHFHFSTIIVNVIGSFIMGMLYYLFEKTLVPAHYKSIILIGFLGAFTTFSTYSLDTMKLLQMQKYFHAVTNVLLNNVLCIGFVFAGLYLGKIIYSFIK